MITFKCLYDTTVQIEIPGYEHPEDPTCNWLMTKIFVRRKNIVYQNIFPAFEIKDIKSLSEWLQCLLDLRLPQHVTYSVTEQCIWLNYISYNEKFVLINLTLDFAYKPNFLSNPRRKLNKRLEEIDWSIGVQLTKEDLKNNIRYLEKISELYPSRQTI